VTETTAPLTPGKEIEPTGVPGGTSTVTVTVWPVASVRTKVRCSALAGSTAAPSPAVAMPAVARAVSSFPRVVMCM
jgi:hypothetical protein